MGTIDVLMITHRSPVRTEISLSRLLEVAGDHMRVWLWQNGTHPETLALVRRLAKHPRVYRFHESRENKKLWEPTNWLLENADGDFLSKVDDDNVVPLDWPERLVRAHEDYERFGVLGSWRFQDEDFVPELAQRKIAEFPGGHRVLQNLWTEGSCFLMKRRCVQEQGLLSPGQTFPSYCRQLALGGWVNGWLYPFVRYENLDDPRAPHTLIKTDTDLRDRLPLTAEYNGVATLDAWVDQLRRSAHSVQEASIDPRHWQGWRLKWRHARARIRHLLGDTRQW